MESAFKIVFAIAIIVFCLVIIALFLLAIKLSLIWFDDISLMGITMSLSS